MGTRGFITFAAGGQEKTAYNHWDSYPEGLGVTVLSWLRSALESDAEGTAQAARELRVVSPDSRPEPEDIARLGSYADESVSSRQLTEWYVLLRATQGSPELMLKAGVIEDAGSFPGDSLFAEWGYVIDFDAQVLEAYEGFQKAPHNRGRFAAMEPENLARGALGPYYPVALAASWPFSALPSNEEFVKALSRGSEDEE